VDDIRGRGKLQEGDVPSPAKRKKKKKKKKKRKKKKKKEKKKKKKKKRKEETEERTPGVSTERPSLGLAAVGTTVSFCFVFCFFFFCFFFSVPTRPTHRVSTRSAWAPVVRTCFPG